MIFRLARYRFGELSIHTFFVGFRSILSIALSTIRRRKLRKIWFYEVLVHDIEELSHAVPLTTYAIQRDRLNPIFDRRKNRRENLHGPMTSISTFKDRFDPARERQRFKNVLRKSGEGLAMKFLRKLLFVPARPPSIHANICPTTEKQKYLFAANKYATEK